jgi:2-amino-4-hydroxy-6-hydroxymethyldihydropteridine diphosphokinase
VSVLTELPVDVIAIGLGGNVGGEAAVRARFADARAALAQLGDVRSAPLYRTAPVGPEQPAFLNTALRVRAPDATPSELIATLLELERLLGRDRAREVRWGPRTIDLDVLLWGTRQLATPELTVPHPRLGERRFVVVPLIALFGEALLVPGLEGPGGSSLGELARAVAAQQVEELTASW